MAIVTRPVEQGERVRLRDGSSVLVRQLATGDTAAVLSWFSGLAPETRNERFLVPLKSLPPRTLALLVAVDHRDHEALVAASPDGTTIGIARYVRTSDPAVAEVAVAVVDSWRGRGLASLLLARLCDQARAAGIRRFTALCLATNYAVIRILTRLGPATVSAPDAGVVEVRIELGSSAAG